MNIIIVVFRLRLFMLASVVEKKDLQNSSLQSLDSITIQIVSGSLCVALLLRHTSHSVHSRYLDYQYLLLLPSSFPSYPL